MLNLFFLLLVGAPPLLIAGVQPFRDEHAGEGGRIEAPAHRGIEQAILEARRHLDKNLRRPYELGVFLFRHCVPFFFRIRHAFLPRYQQP